MFCMIWSAYGLRFVIAYCVVPDGENSYMTSGKMFYSCRHYLVVPTAVYNCQLVSKNRQIKN